MTLLYCFPPRDIFDRYAASQDVIYLSGNELFLPSGSFQRAREKIRSLPKSFENLPAYDPIEHVNFIRQLGPIWSRWSGRGDKYELYIREFALRSIALSQQLVSYGIRVAVFHTAINHHIDSSVVQNACRLAGIPQVFLYHEAVANRLLPMVQLQNVYDRRPLNAQISEYIADDDVKRFKENSLNNRPLDYNYKSQTSDQLFSLNYLLATKSDLKSAIRKILPRQRSFFDELSGFGTDSYLGQLESQARAQRRALEFYRIHSMGLSDVKKIIGSDVVYVIAAHHQPEASSFPEGGHYDNHLDIIQSLRVGGYAGPIIYKEHPTIWNYGEGGNFSRVAVARSLQYYKAIIALGGILIRPHVSLSQVDAELPNSRFITITGSLAIERAFAKRPTVVAGQPWYKGLPFTMEIRDKADWQGLEYRLSNACNTHDTAEAFLTMLLSRTTLANVTGVGIVNPVISKSVRDRGLMEHDHLLSTLHKFGVGLNSANILNSRLSTSIKNYTAA